MEHKIKNSREKGWPRKGKFGTPWVEGLQKSFFFFFFSFCLPLREMSLVAGEPWDESVRTADETPVGYLAISAA